MKISWQWIKDYVDVPFSPPELAEALTHSGLEVENLSRWTPGFSRVVVARLGSFRPHPQSNHLSICTVNDGQRDYSVVCGAPNVKVGERVALALEGAILPDGSKIARTSLPGCPFRRNALLGKGTRDWR